MLFYHIELSLGQAGRITGPKLCVKAAMALWSKRKERIMEEANLKCPRAVKKTYTLFLKSLYEGSLLSSRDRIGKMQSSNQ